jgi:PAS domain S-box-containing protein
MGVILELMQTGLVIADAHGCIVQCNAAAADILGLHQDEITGRTSMDPAWRCVHEDGSLFPGETHPAMEVLRMGRPVKDVTMGVERPDGSLTWISINSAPLTETEGGPGSVTIFMDVTRFKEVEARLELAKKEADSANEAKSRFLAMMSHELRTPMNGIIGFADLLVERELDDEAHQFAQMILESSESLAGILNDILDFSKIEANKLDFEWEHVDVGGVLEEMLPLLVLRAQQKNLQLINHVRKDSSARVWGDRGRIRQVLFNLIGNALKFTHEGSVHVRRDSMNSRMHRFEVVDTGIGIPDEHQSQLFELFSQADTTTSRRFGGTGLGLAISRRLVELMGGSIGFTSQSGQGSTFWFTLPVSDPMVTPG